MKVYKSKCPSCGNVMKFSTSKMPPSVKKSCVYCAKKFDTYKCLTTVDEKQEMILNF